MMNSNNVMNYDDFRTENKPNHSAWDKSNLNMKYWLERVPASKLVMGVPFYGRLKSGDASLRYSSMLPAHDSIDVYDNYYYNGPEMMYDKGNYSKHGEFIKTCLFSGYFVKFRIRFWFKASLFCVFMRLYNRSHA